MTAQKPIFFATPLEQIKEIAPGFFQLDLSPQENAQGNSYKTAGQYVQIQHPDLGTGYFALASAPNPQNWQLLIKAQNELTQKICANKAGNSLLLTKAMGAGFALEKINSGGDVLFFAVGSGIAPIKAAIESLIKKRNNYNNLSLFYGVRRLQDFAFKEVFPVWEKQKITIQLSVSKPEDQNWQGPTEYIQKIMQKIDNPQKTHALLCGMKGMVQETKAKLIACGLTEKQILLNY